MIKYKVMGYYNDYYRGRVVVRKTIWASNVIEAERLARRYFDEKYYGVDIYIYDVCWRG